MCQLFGSIFALQALSIGCHKSFSQCWHIVFQISDTHFLCVCACIVSWWCCLGTGHLIGSWPLTTQGYMLGWLGDVIPTVSSCQLSGGVLPNKSYTYNFHASCSPMGYTTCVNYAFCIIFEWYFVCVLFSFLFCFVYKFPPLIYVPVWLCVLICWVWS